MIPDWYGAGNEFPHDRLNEKMGFEILEVSSERTVGRMPVEGNTQPMGIWHGGATCVLAESLASIAAYAHAREMGQVAMGVEINATHHRPGAEGWITGVATAVRLGRQLTTHEVVLTDDQERRVATARVTCMIAPAPKRPSA